MRGIRSRHPEGSGNLLREGANPRGTMPSDPDFLNLFRHETTIVRLAPGEALFTEGDPGTCMYVVRSGAVRVSTGTTELEQLGPGSILGEMALIEETPRSATVTAVSDCD